MGNVCDTAFFVLGRNVGFGNLSVIQFMCSAIVICA